MKKIAVLILMIASLAGLTILFYSCVASKASIEKTGMQLWGENCIRCHNAPSSAEYGVAQWETIGMHMKLRANLTDDEANRIVLFLKSGN